MLRDADITTCSAEEAVATGVTSVFLPHGIGHLLGLEVHDAGGFMRAPEGGDIPRPDGHPYLRLTRVLEEGFVVTMEPGIYFIDQLLEAARADARGGRINWPRVERCERSAAFASRTTSRSPRAAARTSRAMLSGAAAARKRDAEAATLSSAAGTRRRNQRFASWSRISCSSCSVRVGGGAAGDGAAAAV